jgi:hypothetical protein
MSVSHGKSVSHRSCDERARQMSISRKMYCRGLRLLYVDFISPRYAIVVVCIHEFPSYVTSQASTSLYYLLRAHLPQDIGLDGRMPLLLDGDGASVLFSATKEAHIIASDFRRLVRHITLIHLPQNYHYDEH